MTRSPKKERRDALEALRRFLNNQISLDDSLAEIFEFENAAEPERYADRAAALISASVLEEALRTAILTHFILLDDTAQNQIFAGSEGNGPLSTFSARIRVGFALGIYGPDMKADLETIQLVRNVFAHSRRHLEFSSRPVALVCDQLIFPKKFPWGGLAPKPTSDRDMFIQVAKIFATYLISAPEDAPRRYLEMKGWEEMAS